MIVVGGAGGGTRTLVTYRSVAFEATASTGSATPAEDPEPTADRCPPSSSRTSTADRRFLGAKWAYAGWWHGTCTPATALQQQGQLHAGPETRCEGMPQGVGDVLPVPRQLHLVSDHTVLMLRFVTVGK